MLQKLEFEFCNEMRPVELTIAPETKQRQSRDLKINTNIKNKLCESKKIYVMV